MTPAAYPTKFEVYDHTETGEPTGDPLALVEMQDEASASVEIKTTVNATEWAKLAEVIGWALGEMELQGDKRCSART